MDEEVVKLNEINESDIMYYVLKQGNSYGVKTISGDSLKTAPNIQDHYHEVTVEFKNINITHKHSLSGTVTLNPNSQQKISVVSQHYKIAYIQRIY